MGCALNGVELGSLDPRLYIQDIEEHVKTRADTADRPGGLRLSGKPARTSLTVTVRFMIKERDRAARQRIIGGVNAWAREGWLQVSTRPGQRLYVTCAQPADSETLRWSAEMQVSLTAYEQPYWQDQYAQSARLQGAEGAASLRPTGTRPCHLEAEIVNRSEGAVDSLSLTVNGESLFFSGLGLVAGQALRIDHDGRGWLRARIGGAGRLSCRTPESADELTLYPARENEIAFAADGACDVTLWGRGNYD